jgi:hypothetical protein
LNVRLESSCVYLSVKNVSKTLNPTLESAFLISKTLKAAGKPNGFSRARC